MSVSAQDVAGEFERHRPRLRGLAYRMLGSVSDADDMVQEAYLRWHASAGGTDGGESIRVPGAWLTTAVTRLCIDRLRTAAAERAAYVGPWLPEPWMVGEATDMGHSAPDGRLHRAADLSVAFLLLLERLAPEERAAFLLHDVFDVGYPDIARTLDRSEPACRQMVHRARERVRDERARFEATDADRRRLLEQFLAASAAADEARLLSLFAPDATFTSDGGGKVHAALNVIRGADRIARLSARITRRIAPGTVYRLVSINGELAIVAYVDGEPWHVTAIATDGQRILHMYRVVNPDKLRRVPSLSALEES